MHTVLLNLREAYLHHQHLPSVHLDLTERHKETSCTLRSLQQLVFKMLPAFLRGEAVLMRIPLIWTTLLIGVTLLCPFLKRMWIRILSDCSRREPAQRLMVRRRMSWDEAGTCMRDPKQSPCSSLAFGAERHLASLRAHEGAQDGLWSTLARRARFACWAEHAPARCTGSRVSLAKDSPE